jgi:hypothetical protein
MTNYSNILLIFKKNKILSFTFYQETEVLDNVSYKIKDHLQMLEYIYYLNLIMKYFYLIHLINYLFENHFLIKNKPNSFRKYVFLFIPSLENISLSFEELEIPCCLRIFLIKDTFAVSIIFDHRCSINWIIIERCLKKGRN